jgi:hypothetical protein
LYALGRWSRSDYAAIPFDDVNRGLTELLKESGDCRSLP